MERGAQAAADVAGALTALDRLKPIADQNRMAASVALRPGRCVPYARAAAMPTGKVTQARHIALRRSPGGRGSRAGQYLENASSG